MNNIKSELKRRGILPRKIYRVIVEQSRYNGEKEEVIVRKTKSYNTAIKIARSTAKKSHGRAIVVEYLVPSYAETRIGTIFISDYTDVKKVI